MHQSWCNWSAKITILDLFYSLIRFLSHFCPFLLYTFVLSLSFSSFSNYFSQSSPFLSLTFFLSLSHSFFLCCSNVSLFIPSFVSLSFFLSIYRIQAALASYSRVCYLRFWLSADSFLCPKLSIRGISLNYPRIFIHLVQKMRHFCLNSAPLLSAVLVFAGLFKNVTPANSKGRLYSQTCA